MADVVINRKGIGQLLKSNEVASDLRRRAQRIAATAGEGHEVNVETGRTRVRAEVVTRTPEAMYHEATDRNLTRAFDSGRH
jgi:hypothetical protein